MTDWMIDWNYRDGRMAAMAVKAVTVVVQVQDGNVDIGVMIADVDAADWKVG